jgi:hypothetical protein
VVKVLVTDGLKGGRVLPLVACLLYQVLHSKSNEGEALADRAECAADSKQCIWPMYTACLQLRLAHVTTLTNLVSLVTRTSHTKVTDTFLRLVLPDTLWHPVRAFRSKSQTQVAGVTATEHHTQC